jgi:hypothetical protein
LGTHSILIPDPCGSKNAENKQNSEEKIKEKDDTGLDE